MIAIDTAIVLAAGQGSRLQAPEGLKPLCKVGGKALIDHALDGLAIAGISRVIVVTGFEADVLEDYLAKRDRAPMVEVVRTSDWRQPNGVSALAARPHLAGRPALLVMCDHLVDPLLYHCMKMAGPGPGLRLAVDRRLGHPWIDEDDVTRVRSSGSRILAIGKGLQPYDAYDTGIFAVGPAFFEALTRIEGPSISDAVQGLAAKGLAEIVNCSDLAWIDVDDAEALAKAEHWLASGKLDSIVLQSTG